MPSPRVKRAIAAFEDAVTDLAFIGTIPLSFDEFEGGEEEQQLADAKRLAIEHNYIKARAKLERLMENL